MSIAGILFNVLLLGACAFYLGKKAPSVGTVVYGSALVLKLLAGIALGWIYSHYYMTGDTFAFFDQALEKKQLFLSDPGAYARYLLPDSDPEWKGAARSLFFVKLVSVFAIISNGNYWVTSLWMSFVSFAGALYLYVTVTRLYPNSKLGAGLAFFFFPTVLFWGSGVIKESISLGAIMMLGAIFIKIIRNEIPGWWEWVFAVICVLIVWNLKYYWMAVFLPASVSAYVAHAVYRKWKIRSAYQNAVFAGTLVLLGLVASQVHPNFNPSRILQVIRESNAAFMAISAPDDVIHYDHLDGTAGGMMISAGKALYSGMFRPFLWESHSALQILAALENTVLVLLFVSSCWRLARMQTFELTMTTIVAYSTLLCIFLALSTPNFGTLSRYRVGFLPFWIFLLTYGNPLVERVKTMLFK